MRLTWVKKRYQLTEQTCMSYHSIEFPFVMIDGFLFGCKKP